jgi:conjugal transfer pilus assembly protein TraB
MNEEQAQNIAKATEANEAKTPKAENANITSRKLQGKVLLCIFAGVIALFYVGLSFTSSKPKDDRAKKTTKDMTGVVTSTQFDSDASRKALDEQQLQIKVLTEKLSEISNKMSEIQNSLEEQSEKGVSVNPNTTALDDLRTRIDAVESDISGKRRSLSQPGSGRGSTGGSYGSGGSGSYGHEITTVSFSYYSNDEVHPEAIKTTKDYIPSGTFANAVLLSGADTNAGVHGQTDTTPIVMKVLDNGTLPNGAHSRLKGCFVTAASYGDASSERGQIRLQRLSCVRKDKTVLDVPVEGTINDMGGSDGVRGHVIMRNNKLIWNAGLSGFLSGIGSALQQTASKQSTSPLGVATSVVPSQKSFEYGAYGGANTALGKLADYYIKLADMYHPIVQIHPGSKVNVVFLKGFFLTEGNEANGVVDSVLNKKNEKSSSNEDFIGEGVKQSIQDASLGDSVETEQR